MADVESTSQIKFLKLKDESGNVIKDASGNEIKYPVGAILPLLGQCLTDNFQPSYDVASDGTKTIKNVQIKSPKNINLEPTKGVKFKVGNGAQLELIPDNTGDLREFVTKVWRTVELDSDGKSAKLATDGVSFIDLDDEVPVRNKIICDEQEFNKKGCSDVENFDLVFKSGRKQSAGDVYTKARIKGRAIDLRCYEHGGIAAQICGQDNSSHENKFKIETDRTTALDAAATYNGEGGKGIEIFTMNSQHMSAWAGDYRFKADAPIYAVTRGDIEMYDSEGNVTTVAANAEKYDYPTQSDDFKDVVPSNQQGATNQVTWQDVINVVKYIKSLSEYQTFVSSLS